MEKRFWWILAIAVAGMVVYACSENTTTTSKCKPLLANKNCRILQDSTCKPIEPEVRVCFKPNQVITNTSEYSGEEETILFNYLTEKGLSPVDTCKCEQKLILWGRGTGQDIDIIGAVEDAPKKGGPSGEDAAISENIIVIIPEAQESFQDTLKPIFDKPVHSGPWEYVTVLDTGVDSMGAYLQDFPLSSRRLRHLPLSGGGSICGGRFTDTRQGLDVTDSSSPIPFDWLGHGTHVSGIVVNAMDSTSSSNILLRNVKVSEGDTDNIYLFNLLCGMYYALEKTPESYVINCSLGWEDDRMPETMRPLLNEFEERGVLLVAGAGNNGSDTGCEDNAKLFWPAAFSHAKDLVGRRVVISVGAWDTSRNALWTSSNQCFDVAAPGVDILSSYLHDAESFNGRDYYNAARCSGTSMAAPFISRIAAEMKAANPGLTPAQIKACIISAAGDLPIGIGSNSGMQVKVLTRDSGLNCSGG